jgi:phosphate transport system substrate-binding protein
MEHIIRKTLVIIIILFSFLEAFDIKGRGASFPAPLYRLWISDYYNMTGNRVNYTQTGSGDGIKSVRRQMVDFGASDKPLDARLREKYDLMMFPTVTGAIVLAYHLPGIKDGELKLNSEAVAGIFNGSIEYWDDIRIQKNNPTLSLPHEKIIVVVRADKSGTTYNFTYYLSKIAPKSFSPSKKPEWKANVMGGKGNSGVSATVKQLKYAIGYTEYSYKIKLGLSAAKVENKEGNFVAATMSNFQEAIKHASWSIEDDFYALLAYSKGVTAYPIVAATFVLLPKDADIITNTNVAHFFDYAFRYGDEAAVRLGYVPLPEEAKQIVREYWKVKGVMP